MTSSSTIHIIAIRSEGSIAVIADNWDLISTKMTAEVIYSEKFCRE